MDIAGAACWALYAPVIGVLLLYFWAFLDHAWHVVSFPFQLDYGEMPELNRAWLLSQGRPIYVDWSRPPYQMANYTPLYSAVAAVGVALAGPQFFTGRAISLASSLLSGLAIGVAIDALARGSAGGGRRASLLGAIVGGLLYFTMHPVWNWGALQRVDAFAIMLELAGLALFAAGWLRGHRPWALWATVPVFVAGAYARQTIVAGAFACYGYLLVRRPRLACAVIAAYATLGLALFGVLQLATGGQFARHIIVGNLNRWSWETVDFYWQPFWGLLHWTFAAAGAGAILTMLQRRAQVPLLYFIASAATALSIGKIGSNVNYLLQLCAALALLTGLAVALLAGGGGARRIQNEGVSLLPAPSTVRRSSWLAALRRSSFVPIAGSAVLAVWLLAGLQQVYHVPYAREPEGVRWREPVTVFRWLHWNRLPLWRLDPWGRPVAEATGAFPQRYLPNPSRADWEFARLAHAYLQQVPEDVLGEEMSFTVTTGKRIYLQPFEFTQLAEQGMWDQGPLLADIRRGAFHAVVLRFRLDRDPSWRRQRINQPMIDALRAAYRLETLFGDYYIYVPR